MSCRATDPSTSSRAWSHLADAVALDVDVERRGAVLQARLQVLLAGVLLLRVADQLRRPVDAIGVQELNTGEKVTVDTARTRVLVHAGDRLELGVPGLDRRTLELHVYVLAVFVLVLGTAGD